ncbi:MAG: radical SAM protein [Candidatus Micrarchaeia archaeon]
MGFDPLALARETEKIVARDAERKYYRFRQAGFYGGIATADCVGCNLRCIFCWAWNIVTRPEKFGNFISPEEVAEKLAAIAGRAGFGQARISGNEPTIAREHLLAVLAALPSNMRFILETNGILLGADAGYAAALAAFPNLHVRVSLKGASEEEFGRLTGAAPWAFSLQLKALENLQRAGVSFHPALMASFSSSASRAALLERLAAIHPALPGRLEIEEVADYGGAFARLRAAGLR